MINLPAAFLCRMKGLLKEDFDLFINELSSPSRKAFRVNSEKISLEDFEKICPFDIEKIPFSTNGYYFDFEKIGNHPFHHAGVIYVQEPAAMMPVECIDIKPQWCVLDMCAAPGGKSSQIRNFLSDDAILVSNEIVPSRCKILTGNIERMGFKNTVTTCLSTDRLASFFPKTFDMVMVDAPCSGEGMFRKEEQAASEWSEDNVMLCMRRQADILDNAALLVKNGGYIVYSTCTFSLEENEKTVDAFIKRHPEFEIVKPNERVLKYTVSGINFEGCTAQNIEYTRRFYPHISKGEGQFAAVLKNTLPPSSDFNKKPQPREKVPKLVFDFLDETLVSYKKENVMMYLGRPVYFSPDFSVPKGAAFSLGVTIGEIKKNYILPHHQFFSAMGKSFKNRLDLSLDDPRLLKYLHGEEVHADINNGYCAVSVLGAGLGGAKAVCGTLKNHYPKGLRIL